MVVTSPRTRKSPAKRIAWTEVEDRAAVQFIALHKDEQASESEWPAMRAETDYWSLAARFIKSASGSKYLRKGKLNLSFILFLSLSFVCKNSI